jgi:4-carboxymuconolactone decarboxylase
MAQLPFDPARLAPADRALYDAMVARRATQGAGFTGPYLALMNHPQLCRHVEDLGYYLKYEGHLAREVYQFVVLAVARATGAAFEWDDHVQHALASGVPAEVVATLKDGGAARGALPAPYALAARVLASTLVWRDIPDDVQQSAIAAYGMEGFVEIVVLSGFYQMFAAINQGFAVAPPASGAAQSSTGVSQP